MTDTIKRLGKGTGLHKDAGNVLYTVPGSTTAVVRRVVLTNKSSTYPALATVLRDGNPLLSVMLQPNQHEAFPVDLVMDTGDTLALREVDDMQGTTMTVSHNTSGNSSTDTTAYTTGSWTSVVDGIYVLTVVNSKASAADVVSSISADATHGATWVAFQTALNVTGTLRVTHLRTKTTAAASGTTTINFGATQTGAVWSISRLNGGSTAGTNGEEAVQAAGHRDVLPAVAGSGVAFIPASRWCGARFAAFGDGGGLVQTSTPGTGFTELADARNSDAAMLSTMYSLVAGAMGTFVPSQATTNAIGTMSNVQDGRAAQVTMLVEGVEVT